MKTYPPDKHLEAWLGDDQNQDAQPGALTEGLDLLFAQGPDSGTIHRVQETLRAALATELSRVVYYDHLPQTPLGDVFLAVSDHGVVALNFGIDEQSFVDQIQQRFSKPAIRVTDWTDEAARQVRDYLDGRRLQFELPVDLRAVTDFQRQVLLTTTLVPRGQVTTYGEIARRLGRPRASRAVGQALGQNPIPIIIPCHRVIASDGSLGGYSGGGGIAAKSRLLQLEGVQMDLAG